MENKRKHKWLSILFFSISGIVFGTSLYLITAGAAAPPDPVPVNVASAVETLPYPDEPRVLVTLKRDTRQRVGSLDIIYRGVQDRKIRLDVYVRDLDPQYAYHHAIALDEASRGFRLAGARMELLSVRKARAKLAWNRGG